MHGSSPRHHVNPATSPHSPLPNRSSTPHRRKTSKSSSNRLNTRSRRDFRVTVLGCANEIGQTTSMLLKQNHTGLITQLSLYDPSPLATGVATDLSHIPTNVHVDGFAGKRELKHALHGADIVLQLNHIKRRSGMSKDQLFQANGLMQWDTARHVAKYARNAIILVASPPYLNSVLPLWAETLRFENAYNPAKLMGITTIHQYRAQAMMSALKGQSITVPVIGGNQQHSIIPLWSVSQFTRRPDILTLSANTRIVDGEEAAQNPGHDVLGEFRQKLTERIMTSETNVFRLRGNDFTQFVTGSPLSHAISITKFVDSVLYALTGRSVENEYAFVDSLEAKRHYSVDFFNSEIELNMDGITKIHPTWNRCNEFEMRLTQDMIPLLQSHIKRGVDLTRGIYAGEITIDSIKMLQKTRAQEFLKQEQEYKQHEDDVQNLQKQYQANEQEEEEEFAEFQSKMEQGQGEGGTSGKHDPIQRAKFKQNHAKEHEVAFQSVDPSAHIQLSDSENDSFDHAKLDGARKVAKLEELHFDAISPFSTANAGMPTQGQVHPESDSSRHFAEQTQHGDKNGISAKSDHRGNSPSSSPSKPTARSPVAIDLSQNKELKPYLDQLQKLGINTAALQARLSATVSEYARSEAEGVPYSPSLTKPQISELVHPRSKSNFSFPTVNPRGGENNNENSDFDSDFDENTDDMERSLLKYFTEPDTPDAIQGSNMNTNNNHNNNHNHRVSSPSSSSISRQLTNLTRQRHQRGQNNPKIAAQMEQRLSSFLHNNDNDEMDKSNQFSKFFNQNDMVSNFRSQSTPNPSPSSLPSALASQQDRVQPRSPRAPIDSEQHRASPAYLDSNNPISLLQMKRNRNINMKTINTGGLGALFDKDPKH